MKGLIPIEQMSTAALPAGKTCEDCVHFYRCAVVLECTNPTRPVCDWDPSRFEEKKTCLTRKNL